MKKIFVILILMAIPTALLGQSADDYLDTTHDSQKKKAMLLGIANIKADLRDPDSAKFKGIYYNLSKGGMETTCGTINVKNASGAYIGFRLFFAALFRKGKSEGKKPTIEDLYAGKAPFKSILDEESGSYFAKLWEVYCKP